MSIVELPSTRIEHLMSYENFRQEVIEDYTLACLSREISLLGRKEVLTGKAKFGIFGDGKEVPQIAMAKAFKNGDFRAGYYRDQTFALATGMVKPEQLFAQLYANPELEADPHSAGRQMNNHFATRNLYPDGTWKPLKVQKNSAADNSPTASQMTRAYGLASASKKYRALQDILGDNTFSDHGDEVCFVTIGDASTSEGIFWEVINAAGVNQVPLAVNVWDDGYGISVPKALQTTKGSISEVLQGFRKNDNGVGYDIYVIKGWNYPALVKTYREAIAKMRISHVPALFHIEELTQPQGHSTSGSHERYKSPERLAWEKEHDCIVQMRKWMEQSGIASSEVLDDIEKNAKQSALEAKKNAWNHFHSPISNEMKELLVIIEKIAPLATEKLKIQDITDELNNTIDPLRRDLIRAAAHILILLRDDNPCLEITMLKNWYWEQLSINKERYNSYLHTHSSLAPQHVPIVPITYPEMPKFLSGYQILNLCFDANFARDPSIVAFGEDVGKIGDVNQAFAGLQAKYSESRIYDTGIREASIIGEGIGLAMRGFRPIAEIQYLDYILYGLQPLSDDLACLAYRTKGGQKAPLIVRTRGHRLEGIWHTGSPISMLLGSLRGMHICVPRNMTQAAGFYNLLLRSDEPALVIECLNGYRLKEKIPSNPGEYTVPLGIPEIIQSGTDITIVTYGSCVRIAQEALQITQSVGISVELIDVQTLLPFDITHIIGKSIKNTNRVVFLDEDVPGGGTAYMMQQVMEQQNIFRYLDREPICISAAPHRSAFGSDGDYFCKPNAEEIFTIIYSIMHEDNPRKFPPIFAL